MVSSVASVPYSYLGQLQGASAAPAATAAQASSGSGPSTAPTPASTASSTAQSLVSSLLSGSNGFTPEVLSLLQPDSSGSFDPITSLLGGTGTSDALTTLYSDIYSAAASASIENAKTVATPATASASSGSGASTVTTASSLIAAQTQASIAYNQTNLQNAQAVLAANSYGPNGVTPLVS